MFQPIRVDHTEITIKTFQSTKLKDEIKSCPVQEECGGNRTKQGVKRGGERREWRNPGEPDRTGRENQEII